MTYHKIGTTGTRWHLTPDQEEIGVLVFQQLDLQALAPPEFHHGDCIGSDEHWTAHANHIGWWTVAHPGPFTTYASFEPSDEIREPREYLGRNRDIVNEVDIMVAFPSTMVESQFGGTWYTVRYARQVGRPLVIVGPDGTVTEERCSLSDKLDG